MLAAVADQVRAVGEDLVAVGGAGLRPDLALAVGRHLGDDRPVREVQVAGVVDDDPLGVVPRADDLDRLDGLIGGQVGRGEGQHEGRDRGGTAHGAFLSGGFQAVPAAPRGGVHGVDVRVFEVGVAERRPVDPGGQPPWVFREEGLQGLGLEVARPGDGDVVRHDRRIGRDERPDSQIGILVHLRVVGGRAEIEPPDIGLLLVEPECQPDGEPRSSQRLDQSPAVVDLLLYQWRLNHCNTPWLGSAMARINRSASMADRFS